MKYAIIACVVLLVVCLLFAIAAGYIRKYLSDSSYATNSCNQTAVTALDSAWQGVNIQFGLCITFGFLSLVGIIVLIIISRKKSAKQN